MKSTDALTAGSAEGGARGFPAVITAGLHLTGIYHGVCRGYKAVHQAEYLREWPRPDERADRHRSYALQWFGFAIASLGIWVYFLWRRP